MKIGSLLQFTIPDECPEDCMYKKEAFYQGCTCTRCPVMNCKPCPNPDGRGGTFRMVEPNKFRDDWAEAWESFFNRTGSKTTKED